MQSALIYGISLIAGMGALYGLVTLVLTLPPTRQNLASFLLLLVIAAVGLLGPLLAWLHRRVGRRCWWGWRWRWQPGCNWPVCWTRR